MSDRTIADAIAELANKEVGKILAVSGPEDAPEWAVAALPRNWQAVIVTDHRERLAAQVDVHNAEAFLRAIARRRSATNDPVVYVDEGTNSLVAILDDDLPGQPGRREHRVALDLTKTTEWALWRRWDGEMMAQKFAAELFEERAGDFVTPDSATMLEVAQSIEGSINAEFRSGSRLADGTRQFAYVETSKATAGTGGVLDIPGRFTIGVELFAGAGDVRQVSALFRYSITGGVLKIGYRLVDPDRVEADEFLGIVASVFEAADGKATLLRIDGRAPSRVGEPLHVEVVD